MYDVDKKRHSEQKIIILLWKKEIYNNFKVM